MNTVVENRLNQTDCKLNGWVIEGFPITKPQVNLLKAMRIKPQLVFVLEQSEDECVKRLSNRMLDPTTGAVYNRVTCPAPPAVEARLKHMDADSEASVRNQFKDYLDFEPALSENFRKELCTLSANKSIAELTETMCNEIENTMRV